MLQSQPGFENYITMHIYIYIFVLYIYICMYNNEKEQQRIGKHNDQALYPVLSILFL